MNNDHSKVDTPSKPLDQTAAEPRTETPAKPLVETPVETVVETSAEATAEAPIKPVAETPAEMEAQTPVLRVAPAAPSATGPIYNPVRYFLKSNIFKSITVFLMIVYVYMALYLPVFTVSYEHSDALAEPGILEKDGDIHFSLKDVINDLGYEIKLCYTLDIDDAEDLEEYRQIKENAGKFTDAVDASVFYNATKEDNNDKNFFYELFNQDSERGVIIIAYVFLPIPLLFIIGLAVSAFVSLISTIVTFFKPSSKIKKMDASVCLTTTIFFGVCYFSHLMLPCFRLNMVVMGVLLGVSIAAMVFNIIYKKYTTKIINDRLGL